MVTYFNRTFKSFALLSALCLPVFIQSAGLQAIKTLDEYVAIISKLTVPTIIVFNSSSCTACTFMEPGLKAAVKKYGEKARFYTINTSDPAFKGLAEKMKQKNMPKIEAYPTTHFLNEGTQPRAERGSMGAQEIDNAVKQLVSKDVIKGKPVAKKQ